MLLLLLLGAVVYVNQIGLPDFVKRPLLARLREHGLELQFSRLRLRWYQGVVAENVRFGQADEAQGPKLELREVQVQLNGKALRRFQLQVDALVLHQGRLTWPVVEMNLPPRQLAVENIQTELRFLPHDEWLLEHFTARVAGATVQVTGTVTNASAVRDWKWLRGEPGGVRTASVWRERLRVLADALDRIRFSSPPELRLDIRGDALDLQSFTVRLLAAAPGAETPWGAVAQGRFTARVFPPTTNGVAQAEIVLESAGATTRWAAITNFALHARLTSSVEESNLIRGELRISADDARTPWAEGSNAVFTGRWTHSLANPVPLWGEGKLECGGVMTEWAQAGHFQLAGDMSRLSARQTMPADASWGAWTNLQPYQVNWECHVEALVTSKLRAAEVSGSGSWAAPRLTVTNLAMTTGAGRANGHAELDVASRAARGAIESDIEPRELAPLLAESGKKWLEEISWRKAPRLKTEATVVLPAWTNREPDWRGEVLPTLSVQGEAQFEQGVTFRRVDFSKLETRFAYANQAWRIADLVASRPEGQLKGMLAADGKTKEFYASVASTIDPLAARPLLEEGAQHACDLLTLGEPPWIEGEVWGRWDEPERVGFKSRIALSNFSFQGESFTGLQTELQYTNRVLQVFNLRAQRGTERVTADGLTADFNAQFVYLTNGFSTAQPMVIARTIGPHIGRAIEAYQFLKPPTAKVYGTIPMHGDDGADLHFDLDGGPFHWWKFNLPRVAGHVHWAGETLSLQDVRADFYGGQAAGSAGFAFQPKRETAFRFALATTNVQFHALMTDLSEHTNHLEGWLGGTLVVTNATTADWRTVHGYGNAELRDGLIWDIPLFGIFSPVLNGIVPGLGNSRATAAACSFGITNGVLRTQDLEIRTGTMRMAYRGTVDLESRVNARVEAQLLRDVWLVGPLVSTVFWPVTKVFEYKVNGTLGEPRTEPVFLIPKLMLLPLHPIRTLKGLFPEQPPRP